MEAVKDEAYMNWWRYSGEMADCNVEYPAWKAGRAYQHQFEKSAQHSVHQTPLTPRVEPDPLGMDIDEPWTVSP